MAQTKRNVFITGASGLIGSKLVEKYLEKTNASLFLLVHAQSPAVKTDKRVVLFKGDITKANLGLSNDRYKFLVENVTDIIHCAAETKFSSTLKNARETNLLGTKNVIQLAERASSLKQVAVLSTVYVAGKMVGTIRAGRILNKKGFVNAYEQSKYEMEQFIYKKMRKLPIVIYRLSTVIGDSRTGKVEQSGGIHKAIRLFYNGLIPMVPGKERSLIDLISSNYAAAAIFYLFNKAFDASRVYHISAGKNALTLKEFLASTSKLFVRSDVHWARNSFSVPPIVSSGTFTLLKETVRSTDDRFLKQIIRAIDYFIPQLSYSKVFEPSIVPTVKSENIKDYFPKIIHFCVEEWKSKKYRD
jgi:long-chain acyl-CoA synthetase